MWREQILERPNLNVLLEKYFTKPQKIVGTNKPIRKYCRYRPNKPWNDLHEKNMSQKDNQPNLLGNVAPTKRYILVSGNIASINSNRLLTHGFFDNLLLKPKINRNCRQCCSNQRHNNAIRQHWRDVVKAMKRKKYVTKPHLLPINNRKPPEKSPQCLTDEEEDGFHLHYCYIFMVDVAIYHKTL